MKTKDFMSDNGYLRIALFLPNLQLGGIERITLNLAKGFADKGLDVDIVLVKAEGEYLDQVPGNIHIINLDVSRVAFCLPRLISYLRSHRPSHFITSQDYATPFALFATQFINIKSRNIITLHGMMSHTIENCSRSRYALVPKLMRFCSRWADAIVAVSHNTADNVAFTTGINRSRIEVLYNPVILPGFFELADEHVNHPWFEAGQPPIIISAGRLSSEKDYATLIKAFANICKSIEAHLVILGEGEERHNLELLIDELGISSTVSMPGFVQNPASYISKASVFVLSSRHESLPTVLIEALATGTPIVSTDCPGGVREILKDGLYGKLVPLADPDAMADAIRYIMAQERNPISSDAWYQFTMDTVLDQYLEVLGLTVLNKNKLLHI